MAGFARRGIARVVHDSPARAGVFLRRKDSAGFEPEYYRLLAGYATDPPDSLRASGRGPLDTRVGGGFDGCACKETRMGASYA